MSNSEIKEQIDRNNNLIIESIKLGTFVLDPLAAGLIKQNKELQAQCTHNFVDGKCEFCYIEEKKV